MSSHTRTMAKLQQLSCSSIILMAAYYLRLKTIWKWFDIMILKNKQNTKSYVLSLQLCNTLPIDFL